jgi:predicted ATPase
MADYKFTNISIEGYRRLFSVNNLEIRPLTVMIGANGVGKTSVLEVFSLLAASARSELQNTLSSQFGGFPSILTCGKTENVNFKLLMTVPGHQPLNYILSLDLRDISYEISLETLTQEHSGQKNPFKYIDSKGINIHYWDTENKKLLRPNWEHSPFETSLSQVPKMYQQTEAFRKQLASCTYYSANVLNVGINAPIRVPSTMRDAKHPGHNGENLVTCLYYLRETDKARFEVIEDTIAVAFPGFKHLNFPPVAAGTITMTWDDENFSKSLYMNQLSEGILRFLWLVTLLYSPELTAVTLIDEPEVSLHPQLLGILSDAMREASRHTQLVVATHSDRLIRFLEPSEVLALDSEEGLTQLTWADSLDLEVWLQEYTLDELWRMGQLGGRP